MYIERGEEETLGPTDGLPRCIFACRAQVPTKWSKSEALLGVIFGPKPAPGRSCQKQRRCQGSFWPKAGAWLKWSKTKALPGFIFGPKPAPGRSGQKPRRCQGSFWAEAGASPKWSKTEALPGPFCDKHDVHPSGFGISFFHPHLTSFFS